MGFFLLKKTLFYVTIARLISFLIYLYRLKFVEIKYDNYFKYYMVVACTS